MGSFGGHALPGSIFFLFGAWWTVQVFRRYFLCRKTGKRFHSTATFPCGCCSGPRMRTFPVEAVVKMSLCVVGIIVEFIGGKMLMANTNSPLKFYDCRLCSYLYVVICFFYFCYYELHCSALLSATSAQRSPHAIAAKINK